MIKVPVNKREGWVAALRRAFVLGCTWSAERSGVLAPQIRLSLGLGLGLGTLSARVGAQLRLKPRA